MGIGAVRPLNPSAKEFSKYHGIQDHKVSNYFGFYTTPFPKGSMYLSSKYFEFKGVPI